MSRPGAPGPAAAAAPARRRARAGPGELVRSALYEGTVVHHRVGPPGHRFAQRVTLPLLDLGELDRFDALHRAVSTRRRAPVEFRRSDYLGDPAVPLDDSVRALVAERTGERPDGPVAMLAMLRTWGWLFNPITCYFCYDAAGVGVRWLVAEVTNTPWHDRHSYVVGPPGRHVFVKALHVSPFLSMDQTYRLRYDPPGEQVALQMEVVEGGVTRLRAGMTLRRRPLDRRAVRTLVRRPSRGAPGVSAGIYAQALALRAKGAPVHARPADAR